MARPQGDPGDLIRRLEAALKVATPRDVVNAPNMAKIVGMSWRNLNLVHIEPDPQFPIQKRGSEGVPFEFRVARVLRHMRRRALERIKASTADARRLHKLTGFKVPQGEDAGMPLTDLSKLMDMTLKVQDVKQRQGLYIPVERLRQFLTGYNSTALEALLGTPAKVDPGGALPPAARALMDEEVRAIAVDMQGRLTSFVKEFDAGLFQAGTG